MPRLLFSQDLFRRSRDDDEEPERSPETKQWIPRSHIAVPDLVCVHFPAGDSFMWFEFDATVSAHDFELLDIGEEIGVPDHRIQQEVEQVGWPDMIGFDHKYEKYRGHEFSVGKRQWALENGIAPGQPFCVRFGKPEWSAPSYWDNESDVTYDTEVVRVLPMDPVLVAERWRMCLLKTREERDLIIERKEDWKLRHRQTMRGLYLRSDWYGYSDEMSPPPGVRFTLFSKLEDGQQQWNQMMIASGEDPKGDRLAARDRLFEAATKVYPELTREAFDALKMDRGSW